MRELNAMEFDGVFGGLMVVSDQPVGGGINWGSVYAGASAGMIGGAIGGAFFGPIGLASGALGGAATGALGSLFTQISQ